MRDEDDPTRHRTDEPDPVGLARRERSRATLDAAQFKYADWLPTTRHRAGIGATLRPDEEIARRLMAVHALNFWVLASGMPDGEILAHVEANDLRSVMTDGERSMLANRKAAAAEYGGRMGWTQENMWSLAWALGFEMEPAPESPLIDDVVVGPMLDFLPKLGGDVDAFVQRAAVRSEADVLDLEDLFYCAHNAARSAQLGETGRVPLGFHPIGNGGAVHERRHALTWMISPGVSWEDTDLST